VFGVEGGNADLKQKAGTRHRCEVDRNGSQKSEFLPPKKKNSGVGVGCYPNCRGEIDNRISCEKFMKTGPVKFQLHAVEVLRLCSGVTGV